MQHLIIEDSDEDTLCGKKAGSLGVCNLLHAYWLPSFDKRVICKKCIKMYSGNNPNIILRVV